MDDRRLHYPPSTRVLTLGNPRHTQAIHLMAGLHSLQGTLPNRRLDNTAEGTVRRRSTMGRRRGSNTAHVLVHQRYRTTAGVRRS